MSIDTAESLPIFRIQRQLGWRSLGLQQVWEFRELLYFLAWRDIKVRYKQTVLGASWAILQPLMTMAIFTFFFGRLVNVPSDKVPYPLFSYVALLPWIFFSNGVSLSSNSLVGSANLLTKVYFPRLTIPASAIISGLVDLGVGLLLLPPLMWYFSFGLQYRFVCVLLFILLAMSTALGAGVWLSALNVQYRDVRYLVPFLIQLWMFATPVIYPSSLLTDPWRTLFGINPMVGVIEGFRWSILGAPFPGPVLAVSGCSSACLLMTSLFYFHRMERIFADVV